jgi:DNA polymerase-3 subunit gamma/tau
LDEAHGLSPKSFDTFLKDLEEPPARVTFIWATIRADHIPEAIRSRCASLEFSLISASDSVAYLQDICRKESISSEPAALELLAQISQGHVRDIIKNFEQVAEGSNTISEADVRRVFQLDNLKRLTHYLRAIVHGELNDQIRALEAWADTPKKKAHAIHESLTYIFTHEILKQRWRNPLMSGLLRDESFAIAEQMNRRADANGLPARNFWQEIVDFWKPGAESETESSIIAKAIHFDSLLNFSGREATCSAKLSRFAGGKNVTQSSETGSARRREAPPARASKRVISAIPSSHLFLTKSQVRALWEAGSFLVQEYGALLNTRLSLNHGQLGITDPADGSRLVSDLLHEMGMRLRCWAGREFGFHWIYVHEPPSHLEASFETHIAASIPERYADQTADWVFSYFLLKRFGAALSPRAVRLKHLQPSTAERRWQRHLDLMRMLCRNMDPAIHVFLAGERRPLTTVLGLPKRYSLGISDVPLRRFAVSRTLSSQAWKAMQKQKLAPLTAFSDGAWENLMTGWELNEYHDRRTEREERQAAEEIIHAHWPDTGSILQNQRRQEELNQLWASWPVDPRRRLRSWQGWW